MEEIIEFLSLAGKLKDIPRTGWVNADIKNPESVAEHSFRTAILAMILADLRGIDTELVMKMALLHDLSEIITGDLTPEQKMLLGSHSDKSEEDAFNIVLKVLPKRLYSKYLCVWKEYKKNSTVEAQTALQADKMEMLIQALEYEKKCVNSEKLDHFWNTDMTSSLPLNFVKKMLEKRKLHKSISSSANALSDYLP